MADDVIGAGLPEGQKKSRTAHNFRDLTGQVFSRLTVIDRAEGKKGHKAKARWNCRCQCGGYAVVHAYNLTAGLTKSCGCLQVETAIGARGKGHSQFKHGLSLTPEYRSWISARKRIVNEKDHKYPSYGARGISMDQRWIDSFEAFLEDMGPRPPGTSLDRIDNDGPYSKSNCRWGTPTQQARNKRDTIYLEIRGEKKTIGEWSEISGVSHDRIWFRVRCGGWEPEKAVFTPSKVIGFAMRPRR